MTLTIDTNDCISIDGKPTGLAVMQRRECTVVYTPERAGIPYAEHKMPYQRYSLAHDAPASGVAGRGQFEDDVKALLMFRPPRKSPEDFCIAQYYAKDFFMSYFSLNSFSIVDRPKSKK